MGHVLHARARTAPAVRREMQDSQESLITLNGIRFTNRQKDIMAFMTPFDRVCRAQGIEHRLTETSLDKRPGGADEQDHQRSDSQPLLLQQA